MKKLIYAGIGSRKTPNNVLSIMSSCATLLAQKGYVLRSGGAIGADRAFEKGCDMVHGKKEIFLPANLTGDQWDAARLVYSNVGMASMSTTSKWEDWYARLLLRNVLQILGPDPEANPDPVDFVLFWAPKSGPHAGEVTGGTRWAVKLAVKWGISVNNLADPAIMEKTLKWLKDNSVS